MTISPSDPLGGAIDFQVARRTGIEAAELYGRSRSKAASRARQVAMYVYRVALGWSYPEIGARFGRHHTVVMYAVERIENARGESLPLREMTDGIVLDVLRQRVGIRSLDRPHLAANGWEAA